MLGDIVFYGGLAIVLGAGLFLWLWAWLGCDNHRPAYEDDDE